MFFTGGEHVTQGGSKLANSWGQTELTNSLEKQQLEVLSHN